MQGVYTKCLQAVNSHYIILKFIHYSQGGFMIKFKSFVVSIFAACALVLTAATAQADVNMVPPKPIENKTLDAMVGKWVATSDMMGKKAKEKMEIKWALDHQFLLIKLDAQGIDQPNMKYKGRGFFGLDSQGKVKSWWFDNWGAESVSTGTGNIDGDKVILKNSNAMFSETRTFEMKNGVITMHAKGKMTIDGKDTPYDTTTVYKKQ